MKKGDRVEISKLGHCFNKLSFKLGEMGTVSSIINKADITMFKLDNESTHGCMPYAGCKKCLTKIKEVK